MARSASGPKIRNPWDSFDQRQGAFIIRTDSLVMRPVSGVLSKHLQLFLRHLALQKQVCNRTETFEWSVPPFLPVVLLWEVALCLQEPGRHHAYDRTS